MGLSVRPRACCAAAHAVCGRFSPMLQTSTAQLAWNTHPLCTCLWCVRLAARSVFRAQAARAHFFWHFARNQPTCSCGSGCAGNGVCA